MDERRGTRDEEKHLIIVLNDSSAAGPHKRSVAGADIKVYDVGVALAANRRLR